MRSPRSIYVFEDNDVLITETTLEELDNFKDLPGETGFNARETIRILNDLRESGNLYKGIELPGGGTFAIIEGSDNPKLAPVDWDVKKPDNKIIRTALEKGAILVTNDISMLLKAEAIGVKTEVFRNESASELTLQYSGQKEVYTSPEVINEFYRSEKMDPGLLYEDINGTPCVPQQNEYLLIHSTINPDHSALGFFNGKEIEKLETDCFSPFGVKPRNISQKFAMHALLKSSQEVPLVIIKGPAGTAKTFLSLACGLQQVIKDNIYKKILLLRPNIKFDEDIGYLKGDEMEKILPLIRPCLDNIEMLVSGEKDSAEETNKKIQELFDKGYVAAEALAYLRGRSISNTYILIDEAQNTTPHQMLGIITRAGINSKIVIVGDPDQIDNPKVDKRNNGLAYAAEKMKGSKLCINLSFNPEDCVRSPLAQEASEKLNTSKNK